MQEEAASFILQNAERPYAVDVDTRQDRFYWSDVRLHHIARAFLNGTSEEVIVENVSYARSLEVDEISRNLYWTDSQRKTIEVAKLNGLYRKVLVFTEYPPADLTLDVKRG